MPLLVICDSISLYREFCFRQQIDINDMRFIRVTKQIYWKVLQGQHRPLVLSLEDNGYNFWPMAFKDVLQSRWPVFLDEDEIWNFISLGSLAPA